MSRNKRNILLKITRQKDGGLSSYKRKTNEKSTIICFEPEPDNYIELKNTVEVNNLNTVEILNIAIGDTEFLSEFKQG